jgi:uncharacterized membrane protein YkoI
VIALRTLAFAVLLAFVPTDESRAAEPIQCLAADQVQAAVATHQAIPLGRAMHHAKSRFGGEIVRAQLCRRPNGLVYVLTVLARDGKVTRAIIDAASGKMLVGG